jgi:hypothetical protein
MTPSVSGRSDPHGSAGSFAVGALEPAELADFEAHSRTCVMCGYEVVRFRETLTELSLLTLATPPPTLGTSILDAIRRTPQFPAETEHLAVVRAT